MTLIMFLTKLVVCSAALYGYYFFSFVINDFIDTTGTIY